MRSSLSSWVRGNAVALLALLVALGGTSYAAVSLPRDSVKAPQIAAGAVRTSEIRNGAVTRSDLRSGVLPVARLSPLRPGETVRGYVGMDLHVAVAGGDWRTVGSFAVPLAGEPSAAYVDGVTPGDTCTGSVDDPTAPRNTLCVYPRMAFNPSLATNSHFLIDASRFGFQVVWTPIDTGDSFFFATYAFKEG